MQVRPTLVLRLAWLLAACGVAALGAREEALPGLDFGPLPPREVRVFVPDTGVTAATPVLVALDGQMMGAWRLEAALADRASRGLTVPLVVAITAGAERLDEYGMAGTPDYAGRGRRAAEFQHFVVATVLPAVRSHYGVTADQAHTGIMGASLGGLAAFDLAWHHADTFGFAGVFSGSFWWRGENASPATQSASRLAHRLVRTTPVRPRLRLWFEAGTKDETDDRDGNGVIDAIQDTTELIAELEQSGFRRDADVAYVEMAGGEHNEATWARALPRFLDWVLPAKPVGPPGWAYPIPPPPAPGAPAAAPTPDDGRPKHVPASTVALRREQLAAHASTVPDWHPEEHPPLPDIVARGREPAVWACGFCHLPSGAGRPENASLAGLTPEYIRLQMLNFKNGDRAGSEPRRQPQELMIAIAQAVTEAETAEAAAYFASVKPESFVKVVEAATVPKTYVAGTMLARAPGDDTELIGHRIIEMPDDLGRTELRDSRTTYVAYVPPGSLELGAALVTTGGGGKTQQCALCHGPDLKGLGYIPRLAGRSPSYLMRQLYDIRSGTRAGSAALMKTVVASLSDDDLIAIVAYLASRAP